MPFRRRREAALAALLLAFEIDRVNSHIGPSARPPRRSDLPCCPGPPRQRKPTSALRPFCGFISSSEPEKSRRKVACHPAAVRLPLPAARAAILPARSPDPASRSAPVGSAPYRPVHGAACARRGEILSSSTSRSKWMRKAWRNRIRLGVGFSGSIVSTNLPAPCAPPHRRGDAAAVSTSSPAGRQVVSL